MAPTPKARSGGNRTTGISAWSSLATLYDVTGDVRVRARLEELLDIFVNKIVDADARSAAHYFNANWSVADRNGDSKECEYDLISRPAGC